MWLKVVLFLALLAVTIGADNLDGKVTFENYKVYHVYTEKENKKQHDDLNELREMFLLDFWVQTWDMSVISVPPAVQPAFEKELRLRNLPFKVVIEDLEKHRNRPREPKVPRI